MDGMRQGELGQLVGELFREQKKQPHLMVSLLRHHWPAIVGPKLAAKTHPARIARGTLWINAADASWAYQLQFLKNEILQSVQAFLGSQTIGELRFKMGEIPAPDPQPPEAAGETGSNPTPTTPLARLRARQKRRSADTPR